MLSDKLLQPLAMTPIKLTRRLMVGCPCLKATEYPPELRRRRGVHKVDNGETNALTCLEFNRQVHKGVEAFKLHLIEELEEVNSRE